MANASDRDQKPKARPFWVFTTAETPCYKAGQEVVPEAAKTATMHAAHLPLPVAALTGASISMAMRGELTEGSGLIVLGEQGEAGSGEVRATAGKGNEPFLLSLTDLASVHAEVVITNVILHEFVLREGDPRRVRSSFLPSSYNAQVTSPSPHALQASAGKRKGATP